MKTKKDDDQRTTSSQGSVFTPVILHICRKRERERERETKREKEKDRDRQTDRQTDRHRQRNSETRQDMRTNRREFAVSKQIFFGRLISEMKKQTQHLILSDAQ